MTPPPTGRSANAPADLDRLLRHYRQMCRIRAFEEVAEASQKAGKLPGFIHLSNGQEAVPVGVCAALRRDDVITSTHRGHGHTLAKGAEARAMMLELFGRVGGTSNGKGGSMHVADFAVGMLGANGVVADGIPMAVGAAHAFRMRRESRIAAPFFGDGAINRGPFVESLNWAAAFKLPVLFVCEDNGWSATTITGTVTVGSVGPRAEALGIPVATCDGNDPLDVEDAAQRLAAEVRGGAGPRLLWAKTQRFKGHTGADPQAYRDPDALARDIEKDPLPAAARRLQGWGMTAAQVATVRAEALAEMQALADAAEKAAWPPPRDAYSDVQDVGAPAVPEAAR